ncbi:MAG: LptF/LptG family permease [Myxococcaceae bacterium]
MTTLVRYIIWLYLKFLGGIWGAITAIYLVTDFVDRAKDFQGEGWVLAALELYANKTLVVAHQLGPAALLLAAGATVSTFRRRGELLAMKALGTSPRLLFLPIVSVALLWGIGLTFFDEIVVARAARRVEQLSATRFHRWGDWRIHFTPKRWFRHGDRVFFLRNGDAASGFFDVTILELSPEFRLNERIDAARMDHVVGTQWQLSNVVERRFHPDGSLGSRTVDTATYTLGVDRSAFNIHLGRPEQMRFFQLLRQLKARASGGLPTRGFELALHNRVAYPLSGMPGALVAVGLALRARRRGHLTAALVEGMAVCVALWGLWVLFKALAMSDRLSPPVAAWAPLVLLMAWGGFLWARREGRLGGPVG